MDSPAEIGYIRHMPECPPAPEIVEFDDPALANLLFGPRNAHLDLLAAAITWGADVTRLGELDLVYSPPVAPVYDPILIAASQAAKQICNG